MINKKRLELVASALSLKKRKNMHTNIRSTILTFLGFILLTVSRAQTLSYTPTFPKADQPLTITINVKGTTLQGYTEKVWIWSWIDNPGTDYDAPTNINPATSPAQDAALMNRSVTDPDVYSITITPTVFFNKTAADISKIGIKLKSQAWSDNKQSDNDLFIEFYSGGFQAKLVSPSITKSVIKTGETLNIEVVSSESADVFELYFGTSLITSAINTDRLTYAYNPSSPADIQGKVIVKKSGQTDQILEFTITVIQPTVNEARPVGIKDGINYIDDQTVVLSLLAPMKDFVVVIGEFNDWKISSEYQMKKDGEHFWLQISGLTKGVEYAFQYLVDGKIRVADPFSDKILDPDDSGIPANSYPNPKAFPSKANYGEWYEKRLSVIQTGQENYQWQASNFQAPKKEDLIIYELLIRDFFASDQRNYQNLIDTLSYFKKLGINAIELMPVTEFNGNDSWGYNPAFMFAVDKAYGTKTMLKQFIDEAHKAGIAVILDLVLNQQDRPNPYLEMYWDGNAPAANNPWFNRTAKHPFNVFSDMNHESAYTKAYVDTVANYWLTQYKFDGFRFDLSKGFTQQDNLNNQAAWDAYDASRIAILKRIATKIWSYKPEAYVILEHFGSDQEEEELSDAGLMLWGNMNGAYKDAAVGNAANFSRGYFKTRNWSSPNLVTYMESHDEERVMYHTITNGLSNGSYNIKSPLTALHRMKLNAAFFFLVPGPKMLWEFEELGFDTSIRLCTNGTFADECRANAKPPLWEYQELSDRIKLFKVYQKLIALRKTDAFKGGEFNWTASDFTKRISITHSSMNVIAFGNFSTSRIGYTPSFPAEGVWYDYLSGDSIHVLVKDSELFLDPGEFHVYTSKRITLTSENIVPFKSDIVLAPDEDPEEELSMVYPNPSDGSFKIKGTKPNAQLSLTDLAGRKTPFQIEDGSHDQFLRLKEGKPGIYILEIRNGAEVKRYKLEVER
jgi:1,4-alpha-glucan branching enzyme